MEEYTQGFDVTQNLQYQAHQCVIDACEMGLKNGIEQGRNEAWEAARKLRLSRENDPSMTELRDIFGVSVLDRDTDILRKFSASEVIEKIKAWEEKKAADDKIKVGDELQADNHTYVVLNIYGNIEAQILVVLMDRGNGDIDTYQLYHDGIKQFKKTGNHFPEIAEVLEKMKNGE